MSKDVYVHYTVPVVVRMEINDDGAFIRKVVVVDEELSDIVRYEDEAGGDAEMTEGRDVLDRVDEALGGEWPGWVFGW